MDAAAASSSSVRSLSANSSHEKINCRAIESMTASRAIIQYCSPTLFFRALLLIAKLIKISDLVCFASFGIYGSMRKNCILLSLSGTFSSKSSFLSPFPPSANFLDNQL